MSVTVYWAPNYEFGNIDWNMLYADPISVFDKQIQNKTDVDKWDSMFYCPAFKNLTKNTLEFKNPLASSFTFDENGNMTPSKNSMSAQVVRKPNIQDRILLEYGITPIFFSDSDISVTMT